MKPEFLDRSVDHDRSASVTRYHNSPLVDIWHYHQQIELVGIVKAVGTRFVGDNIEKFESSDIVLIGENLPHMWQVDYEESIDSETKEFEVIAIHLGTVFSNSSLLDLPEYAGIRKLIELSKRGMLFNQLPIVLGKIAGLHRLGKFERFSMVMEILNDLADSTEYKLLSSDGFVEKVNDHNQGRLQEVHDYVMNNFQSSIDLIGAAEKANMNPSSFSRYFKKAYGKTFSQYVGDIRLGYACRHLQRDQLSIAEICFQSGFNNISNFNKQFKLTHGLSPSAYRKKFRVSNT
ncbi:MAG: helix-turn-helix domain-containing protein [Cyclobacteriaceae bacterium]